MPPTQPHVGCPTVVVESVIDNIAGRTMPRNLGRAATLGLLGLSACIFQHRKQPADTTRPDPKPATTSPTESPTQAKARTVPPKGVKNVAACRGKNGIDEACAWRYEIDESKCPKKCTKLVAFFAGDSQDCGDHEKMLSQYSEKGYFATCISLFETVQAANKMPFSEQAVRADAALKHMMASPEVIARWEGGHLLLAGTGHGATVPVTAMARTEMDEQDHWRGILTTGGCFFDGIVDVFSLEERLQSGAPDGGACEGPLTPARLEARYAYMPEAKAQDSITGVSAAHYSAQQWKLLECGSGMDACKSDVTPAGPIEQLCATISAGEDHLCEFESIPKVDHTTCANHEASRCIDWFDKLLERQ